jgi:hypothetical protein
MSRSKPTRPRTIRLVRTPGPDGVALVCLDNGKEATCYTLCEIPCEIGGRGFALHRTGLGTLYHVRIGTAEECDCDCLGFLQHGHCKHVLGLLALLKAGRLAFAASQAEASEAAAASGPGSAASPLQTAADAARPAQGDGPPSER